ncbi:ABC transporter ATP-binding protein [Rhodohalobacter sulfatireducens]|uniref:ABC transporter ATP-binding protein n=1 Tax=Rhodohalobacter sulfatireducens TaxID=2911366 RepID=A0ABS9KAU7_9BACT|nr:ABC transporter ATP-binding protein [Rhodohalobacter sulfatireducens]MCG2587969.1 ABC transporter ATP-binding protein [Rhodohalobacter sulfatireducens]
MVTVEKLTFAFQKNEPLFTGLDMRLEAGNTYGLFGLNGAGKTTLLNQLSGMLFPHKGSCTVLGENVKKRLPKTMSEIYILPEQFDLPKIDAEIYAELHAPFYPRFDHTYLSEILNEFQVDRQKNLTELSYGQRKKFLIAFALSTNSKLVLMDEPTNGLDIPSKSQFRKIMAASDQSNRCFLISTHQVRDLDSIIDHVIVLNNGKIIFQQSVMDISTTLSFEKLSDDSDKIALYSEDVFGGKAAIISKNKSSKETQIDLELLFNGIIQKQELINNQFKS